MNKKEKHIIIVRFSALGDVAIAAPLVKEYAAANPEVRFTFVSLPRLKPLFEGVDNLLFFPVDLKGSYKGFGGMFRLFKKLRSLDPTNFADFHNVIRTWMLRFYFFFTRVKINFIDKGRREKGRLTRKRGKVMKQLETSMSRYEKVLVKAGLQYLAVSEREEYFTSPADEVFKIGFAPFAKHKGKCWPAENAERLIEFLSEDESVKIYLFGGGKEEVQVLMSWQHKYPGVESMAGKYDFKDEMDIIGKMDLMITMDSANMHLASCKKVPVISIWGATHPYAGFTAWGQSPQNIIQSDLSCRPCSVFGNKKCFRGDYACLNNITPEIVLDRIKKYRNLHSGK